MAREHQQTDIGDEVQCAKCSDFWPADSEFFYMRAGRPHSWCKACYVNDPKTISKVQRWAEKTKQMKAGARV